MMKPENFYLGRLFDYGKGELLPEPAEYDPSHLTTHAVITGMTGSGKTGLGVVVLEEAALHNLPAIIIDPKGDLTNLLLHFPELKATDFEPWVDPEAARREGKTVQILAAETAQIWEKGLASWGLGKQHLQNLQSAVAFKIFTPGSTSGIPVNIVSSFQASDISWEENSEILRERIASTVTGLLSLIGLTEIDPLRSREHILISNILEAAWSQGSSLDMIELIMQVQKPPFKNLGAFPVDRLFPEKERFDLAMLLNNFLAAPSFQPWLQGQSLDVQNLLYQSDGKPRHSIFYLAHLSENERMFFVTLLFAAIETWMRMQRGTSGLRALVYFDEIMGYLPPVANPPSRTILLRMLKQARAFGVGLVLATQNPMDLDYKALSNAGTWMIGRLQTERDKMRLLEGLMSASAIQEGDKYDEIISGLGKRVFLLHNVHKPGAKIFQTRWCLNYLAGPLTRTQIPELRKLIGAETASAQIGKSQVVTAGQTTAGKESVAQTVKDTSSTRPTVPGDVMEFFLPAELDLAGAAAAANYSGSVTSECILYRPALLTQGIVRYINRTYNLDYARTVSALMQNNEGGLIHWEKHTWRSFKKNDLHSQPLPNARFVTLPDWLSDASQLKALQKDFMDWLYRSGTIHLHANPTLKIYANPDVTKGQFVELCSQAANQESAAEKKKLEDAYEKKLIALENKIKKQEMSVEAEQDELNQRRLEEAGAGAQLVFSLLGKRRRSVNTSLTKRRMTAQSKKDLEQEKKELEMLKEELADLEKEKGKAIEEIQERWAKVVSEENELPIQPAKKDIYNEYFGVAWLPYYLVKVGSEVKELPAFRVG